MAGYHHGRYTRIDIRTRRVVSARNLGEGEGSARIVASMQRGTRKTTLSRP